MSLQLIKMEDGVCDGEVLHHEFSESISCLCLWLLTTMTTTVTKDKKDILETKKRHRQRR